MAHPVPPPGRLAADERGFTVVELMVTLLVMSLVLAGSMSMFHGLLQNDRYQTALVSNQENVRRAMVDVARDVRGANPLLPLTTMAAYDTSIQMAVGQAASPTRIRWELVGSTLYRRTLDASLNVTSSRVVLKGVDNSTSLPMFKLYDEAGNRLDTTLTNSPADVARCAVRVVITLHAADDPVGAVFTESSAAELRNQIPGGVGCTYTP